MDAVDESTGSKHIRMAYSKREAALAAWVIHRMSVMLSCIVQTKPEVVSWSSGVLAVSHRLGLAGVLAAQPCLALPCLMILTS